MDFLEQIIKKENDFEIEDSNDNYLQLDFEIGVKVENDSPGIEDWCVPSDRRYQDDIVYEDVKEELELNTCALCFKMFDDSISLYRHNLTHLRVVVTEQKHMYQCDYCLFCYTSKTKLVRHIQSKHFLLLKNNHIPVTDSVQRCVLCEKVFSYKSWHSHMKDVHGCGTYRCEVCNVTFKCLRYLSRHLLYTHGNVRPKWRFQTARTESQNWLKCHLCPTLCRNKSAYNAHVSNCHTNEPQECRICHSKLKCKSYLLTHMKRVHFNDGKVHECDICTKVFRSQRYLKIHKKNSHYVKVKAK